MPPPASNAARSSRAWSSSPASGPLNPAPSRSDASTLTTKPEFAYGESRRDKLMPFTTTVAGSVDAGTMNPPGHMQNENTPRSLDRFRDDGGYDAAGSAGWRALAPYWMRLMSSCGCSMRTPSANGFRFEVNAFRVKERLYTSRAECPVASTTASPSELRAVQEAHATDAARPHFDEELCDACPKQKSDARFFELFPEARDDFGKLIRADVRARVRQNIFRSAVANQDFDDVADAAALVRARVELAVAVRTRAALAEAIVAVGIDLAATSESL